MGQSDRFRGQNIPGILRHAAADLQAGDDLTAIGRLFAAIDVIVGRRGTGFDGETPIGHADFDIINNGTYRVNLVAKPAKD